MPMWVHRPALRNLGTPRDGSRWRHMYGGIPSASSAPSCSVSLAQHLRGYTHNFRPIEVRPRASPLRCSKRINFECTVPLPSRPARQPKATKRKTRAIKPNTSKKPPRTPTPLELQERRENRREYEQNRSQRTERKQYGRDWQKKRRQRGKELGICKTCSQPAIPDQTRCPSCAEKNRQQHRSAKAKRQAANTAAQQNNPGASLPPSSE